MTEKQRLLRGATQQLTALGEAIRNQRKILKVSATAAAESAGLSRVTWHRLEKGEPSVSAGAYFSALSVLGLTAQANANIKKEIDTTEYLPLKIPLAAYPQLKFLAWQLQNLETLTPKEAWGIYQRNWRHLEQDQLTEQEAELIHKLQQVYEG